MITPGLRAIRASKRSKTKARPATRSERKAWADAIRAPVYNHPKQLAFVSSPAKLKVSDKNRRAGGTEGVGRWDLADLIEYDSLYIEVYSETIGLYSKNWLCRAKKSALDLLETGGLRERVDYTVHRSAPDEVKAINFSWGSRLRVLPAADAGKLSRARGAAPDKIRGDECQDLGTLPAILTKIIAASGADFDADVILTGTPGAEVDTTFHELTQGGDDSWEVHHFYSVDNPHFGDSWAARWEKAVHSRIRMFRQALGVSAWCLAQLGDMTEERFHALARTDVESLDDTDSRLVKELPDDVLREFFGRWVAEASEYIFASVRQMPVIVGLDDDPSTGNKPLYWARAADGLDAMNTGEGDYTMMMSSVDAWAERLASLPTVGRLWGERRRKPWYCCLGGDLGFYPGAFALVPWLWSPEDSGLYELGSAKASRLTEPQQFDILQHWCEVLAGLDVRLVACVLDAGGAEAPAVVAGWLEKLRDVLPAAVADIAVEPARKADRWAQMYQLNVEIRAGRVHLLENSPLHIEMTYLQRLPRDETKERQRPEEYAKRKVEAGGVKFMPANHCAAAGRYGWYYATHVWCEDKPDEVMPDPVQQLEASMLASELRAKRKR